jgi:hypothetical protein
MLLIILVSLVELELLLVHQIPLLLLVYQDMDLTLETVQDVLLEYNHVMLENKLYVLLDSFKLTEFVHAQLELPQLSMELLVELAQQTVMSVHHHHNVLPVKLDSLYNQMELVLSYAHQDNMFQTQPNHQLPPQTQPLPLPIHQMLPMPLQMPLQIPHQMFQPTLLQRECYNHVLLAQLHVETVLQLVCANHVQMDSV